MRIPYAAIIGTMIAASLLVLSTSVACGREDHERIAEDVAREWTMTEADGISEEIAEMATRRYGGRVFVQIGDDDSISPSNASAVGNLPRGERIPTAAAADQIQRTIQWEFGPPTRKGTVTTKSLLRRRYPSTSPRPSPAILFARYRISSPSLRGPTRVQSTTNWTLILHREKSRTRTCRSHPFA